MSKTDYILYLQGEIARLSKEGSTGLIRPILVSAFILMITLGISTIVTFAATPIKITVDYKVLLDFGGIIFFILFGCCATYWIIKLNRKQKRLHAREFIKLLDELLFSEEFDKKEVNIVISNINCEYQLLEKQLKKSNNYKVWKRFLRERGKRIENGYFKKIRCKYAPQLEANEGLTRIFLEDNEE